VTIFIGLCSGAAADVAGVGGGAGAAWRGRVGTTMREIGFGARAAALGATMRFKVPAVA